MKRRITAIVLAAGRGTRFRQRKKHSLTSSKVFQPLNGRPMLAYSLDALARHPDVHEIIVVVPRRILAWVRNKYLRVFPCAKVKQVVAGGAARSDSAALGFSRVHPRSTHVMIHDAARPLIRPEAVRKLVRAIGSHDGAILARKLVPTIKQVGSGRRIQKTISRDGIWEAETPQLFSRAILRKGFRAYRKAPTSISDDAGICERVGGRIRVVEHPSPNLKVTTQADFRLAAALMNGTSAGYRWGIGHDIHRLVPKRKLILGGIAVPSPVGALGHSDGDALLHAVTDALLGASGSGDIGDWFPDSEARLRGVASKMLLRRVVRALKSQGFCPVHVDTTVHLERPKLGKYKLRIQTNLARLLGIRRDQVNIKAKTAEGLGRIGQNRAVSADAIACLEVTHG